MGDPSSLRFDATRKRKSAEGGEKFLEEENWLKITWYI
jgi:hypothetical protein